MASAVENARLGLKYALNPPPNVRPPPLLETSMPSGDFMNWGDPGLGQWITLYANGGHIFMTVAGLRFDTSGASGSGSRWQSDMRSARGYTVRHPVGL